MSALPNVCTYYREGEPGKDGTEAGQMGKDGERTDQD